MAQSLLTQRGVEYASTMRTLQAVAAKKHVVKKWRSRNQSCSESSSSSSYSCSSSDSEAEGSTSRSSTTAEREFSIVKESTFTNGPLKLKIAARRIKKAQDVANSLDQEDCSLGSPCLNSNCGPQPSKSSTTKCRGQKYGQEEQKHCKRKSGQKRCLKTKDSRVPCNGQYPNCKGPRKTRRCSTSGSSSSSSSSGSSSGSSGRSSSSSSSASSTACSSNSSSGNSTTGSSSSTGSSGSSSSSSSGSSSSSESDSCCTDSNCGVCKRQKKKLSRKTSTKCQATCTLQYKATPEGTNSSHASISNDRPRHLSDKSQPSRGKRLLGDGARNKKLQVSDIDYFSNSSSEENMSVTDDKENSIQESFSVWRKVEEKHCAIIEDPFKSHTSDLQMQVLSVTNAEVECNINVSTKIDILCSEEEKQFVNNINCKNQKSTDCDFNFNCMEPMPSIIKEHTMASSTSLDLDTLPVSLSNVSPDSGIQSSGDSPLRVECDMQPTSQNDSQSLSTHEKEIFERTEIVNTSTIKPDSQLTKQVSPTPSPPVLTPSEPLWISTNAEPQPAVEKQKSAPEDHPAPLLIQEDTDTNSKTPAKPKVDSIFSELKELEFPNESSVLQSDVLTNIDANENKISQPSVNSSISCDEKPLNPEFSHNSLHLIFSDQPIVTEKSETVFSVHPSPQSLSSSSESKRRRTKSSKRQSDANSKADNELHLLVQSVQDSICSQFQGMESDELSDVDVNSIPVTALTCDATSDSFCDKLPSEDNIDMFLDDRPCVQTEDKSKCPDKDLLNCIASESEYITSISLCDKPQDKDAVYSDNSSKYSPEENQIKQEHSVSNSNNSSPKHNEIINDQLSKAEIQNNSSCKSDSSVAKTSEPDIESFVSLDTKNEESKMEISVTTAASGNNIFPVKDAEAETSTGEVLSVDEKIDDSNQISCTVADQDQVDLSVDTTLNVNQKKTTKKVKRRTKSRSSKTIKVPVNISETFDSEEKKDEVDSVDIEKSDTLNQNSNLEDKKLVEKTKSCDESVTSLTVNESNQEADLDKSNSDPLNNIQLLMEIPITVTDESDKVEVVSDEAVDTSKPLTSNVLNKEALAESVLEIAEAEESLKKSKSLKGRKNSRGRPPKKSRKNFGVSEIEKDCVKLPIDPEIQINDRNNLNEIDDTLKNSNKDVTEDIEQKSVEAEEINADKNSENVPENSSVEDHVAKVSDEIESRIIKEMPLRSSGDTTENTSVDVIVNNVVKDDVNESISSLTPISKEKPSKQKKNKRNTSRSSKQLSEDINTGDESEKDKTKSENSESFRCEGNVNPLTIEKPVVTEKLPNIPKVTTVDDSDKSKKKTDNSETNIVLNKSPRSKRKKETDSKNIVLDNLDAVIEEVINSGALSSKTEISENSVLVCENLNKHDDDLNEEVLAQSSRNISRKKQTKKTSIENMKNAIKSTKKDNIEPDEELNKNICTENNSVTERKTTKKNVSVKGSETLEKKSKKSTIVDSNEVLQKQSKKHQGDGKIEQGTENCGKTKSSSSEIETPTKTPRSKIRKNCKVNSGDIEIANISKESPSKTSEKDLELLESLNISSDKQIKQKATKGNKELDISPFGPLNCDIELNKEYLQKKAAKRRSASVSKKELVDVHTATTLVTDTNKTDDSVHADGIISSPVERSCKKSTIKNEVPKKHLVKTVGNSKAEVVDSKVPKKKKEHVKRCQKDIPQSKNSPRKNASNSSNKAEVSRKAKNSSKGSKDGLTSDKANGIEVKKTLNNIESNQHSSKCTKKDSKIKVDEEKENFDIGKTDPKNTPKHKARHSKEMKSTTQKVLSDDLEKHIDVENVAGQSRIETFEKDLEKEDGLPSMYGNDDEYHVNDNLSDAYASSGIDKHSLERRHIKKKKTVKKYSEDPNFIADLEKLAKLLKNCHISKKSVKIQEEDPASILPAAFRLKDLVKLKSDKSVKTTASSKTNKVTKAKQLMKKKPKRFVKKEAPPKILSKTPSQKTKTSLNENCLPLKKRRCLVSTSQAPVTKNVPDVPVSKAPVKRNLCMKNFDETIEECIRKHMMSDEVPPEKETVPVLKSKPKKPKKAAAAAVATSDSIDETINTCVKMYTPKEKSTVKKNDKNVPASEKKEIDVDDMPLASLVKLKRQKTLPKPPPPPKISNAALAYRNKRKRILKEACEQAQKTSKVEKSEVVLNGQKKRRRFRNRTGFVRVKKKKARPSTNEVIDIVEPTPPDKDVIDLTAEDTVLDAIESVIKSSVEETSPRSRRKRKNVAQKCEIEVLDITSGGDDNDIEECPVPKKPKSGEEEEELEPKYMQVIQVTEPSAGRKLAAAIDPRKAKKREVNFPKKKFLRAGLYSASFKQDSSSIKKTPCSKKSKSREVKEYNPEDFEFGLLPPPIHVGKYLREKRCEYKLPFDLWWLYKNKQLVYNDELANNYKKIRTNVYVDIKPDYKSEDQQPCNCVPPKDTRRRGCGAECLNRMMYVECSPQLCPCTETCSNQRIFKHEWSPGLQRFMTRDRGWGIRTTEFIRNGEFILEYVGEVVSDTEFRHRMAERYQNDQHHYCLSLDSGTVIDGYRLAGEGRFVNHSCEPNCEMQKWYVNGHYRVGLFAMRDIYPNTELCYDYNFINYNLETQQICRCGSSKCRGFIGGRSQRLNGQNKEKVVKQPKQKVVIDSKKKPGRPKKRKDDKPVEIQKDSKHIKNEYLPYNRQSFLIQMKPMSHQQRCYVQKHHCFLLRNYEKVKKAKDQARLTAEKEAELEQSANKQDAFLTQFTALSTARSVKTRRLAIVEENTELTKTARLAQVFKDIFTAVTSCKGDDGNNLANPFFNLPSKRKNSEYYNKIKFPIDFTTIEKNIVTGHYVNVEAFEDDFLRLFENAEDFYGRTSDYGHKISHLRKVYESTKTDAMILFEDILGEPLPAVFSKSDDKNDEDDEVIRCICNIYKDEGLMIQCEKCLVWQHCDCVGVDGKVEKYLCEQCSGVELSKEILMVPRPHYASPECQYYLTLLKDDKQIKQGDCVYLRRDYEGETAISNEKVQGQIIAQGMESGDAATRESLRGEKTEQLDIFRIERLWKDDKGVKYAFGHHYLRPHETFHEPSRKFFANEVFRVPLYEIISFEAIVGQCCVLDLPTYCKGRPKGFKEEDVYICEYRVDKTAHFFNKISKQKYPICTKKYAFDHFEKRLNPKRTFLPHTVPSAYRRRSNAGDKNNTDKKSKSENTHKDERKKRGSVKEIDTRLEETPESREKKRAHLNELLRKLLSKMPCKQTVDLSYLLEGGLGKRIRRKTNLSMS